MWARGWTSWEPNCGSRPIRGPQQGTKWIVMRCPHTYMLAGFIWCLNTEKGEYCIGRIVLHGDESVLFIFLHKIFGQKYLCRWVTALEVGRFFPVHILVLHRASLLDLRTQTESCLGCCTPNSPWKEGYIFWVPSQGFFLWIWGVFPWPLEGIRLGVNKLYKF